MGDLVKFPGKTLTQIVREQTIQVTPYQVKMVRQFVQWWFRTETVSMAVLQGKKPTIIAVPFYGDSIEGWKQYPRLLWLWRTVFSKRCPEGTRGRKFSFSEASKVFADKLGCQISVMRSTPQEALEWKIK